MKTRQKRTRVAAAALFVAVPLAFSLIGYAGNLEPNAPPGPTMKTLDEVEPRTPIHAADLPLTITQSGSYYLAENITFGIVDVSGITIAASNVTIDLNRFELKGPGSGTMRHGITVDSGVRSGITVMNGCIVNWVIGIQLGGKDNQVRNINVSDNVSNGIDVGERRYG
ncbi:MAG: hypothetical protein ACYS76_04965 [Planctomycetota bacterium]|jgi:hypothetical protein